MTFIWERKIQKFKGKNKTLINYIKCGSFIQLHNLLISIRNINLVELLIEKIISLYVTNILNNKILITFNIFIHQTENTHVGKNMLIIFIIFSLHRSTYEDLYPLPHKKPIFFKYFLHVCFIS